MRPGAVSRCILPPGRPGRRLADGTEVDVDALSDGQQVIIGGAYKIANMLEIEADAIIG